MGLQSVIICRNTNVCLFNDKENLSFKLQAFNLATIRSCGKQSLERSISITPTNPMRILTDQALFAMTGST